MKKTSLFLTAALLLFLFASFAWAADEGLVPCGNTGQSACTLCHLISGIKGLIDWGAGILGILAIFAILLSGIIYIVSAGDSQIMEKAKSFMKAALIGTAVFLCAWLIVNATIYILGGNIGNATGKGWYWYNFSCDTYESTGYFPD